MTRLLEMGFFTTMKVWSAASHDSRPFSSPSGFADIKLVFDTVFLITVPTLTVSLFLVCFRFLLQSLEDLDSSLRKLNSRLFVIRGQPTDVFPRLFKVTRLSDLYRPEVAQTQSLSVFIPCSTGVEDYSSVL